MTFLILEDDASRQKHFNQHLIGNEVTIKATTTEVIQLLESQNWDVLSLDHDLNQQTHVVSGPGTGFEVAQWLVAHPERKPKLIVFHTFNTLGASNMSDLLLEGVYLPGAWMMQSTEWEKEYQRTVGGIKTRRRKKKYEL